MQPPIGYGYPQYYPQGNQGIPAYKEHKRGRLHFLIPLIGATIMTACCFMPWVTTKNGGQTVYANGFGNVSDSFFSWFPKGANLIGSGYARDGLFVLVVGIILILLSFLGLLINKGFISISLTLLGSVGDFFLIRKILDILDKLKDSNGSGNVGLGLLIGVGGAVLVLLEVLFLLTRRKTSN
ncbi:hypothetical protein OZ401_003762 [Candidatus Chlorohelix allophototropha]|nr:hypothetical protein OZ401_003762 [Chloroflexota bacterium L227-S17]